MSERSKYRVVCASRKHLFSISHWPSDRFGAGSDRQTPPAWAPWHYEVSTVIEDHPGVGMLVTAFPSHEECEEKWRWPDRVEHDWVHGDTLFFHEAIKIMRDQHALWCDSPIDPEQPGSGWEEPE